MAIEPTLRLRIKEYLISKIRTKMETYEPETSSMPFHHRLMRKEHMAVFSFIHSINTSLGQSIFEHVGKLLVAPRSKSAIAQYNKFEGYVSSEAVLMIDSIVKGLRAGTRSPNKSLETQEVIAVAKKGDMGPLLRKRVDLFVKEHDGSESYYEIKTAKPNIDVFEAVKTQLLSWIAMRASVDDSVQIRTIVTIPYNPYDPEPYARWTLQGLIDIPNQELLVGEEFWDRLGGAGTYQDLLNVFEEAGNELYDEIQNKIASFR